MKNEIILLGGGGHAKVLIKLIDLAGEYRIAGILDQQLKKGTVIEGVAVLGDDKMLQKLRFQKITNACISIGSTRDNTKRKQLYKKVKNAGFLLPALIHPKAIVSSKTKIHDGAQIMAGAIVQASVEVGVNSIINTGAIVEHDCMIGAHVHVCPGVVMSGSCRIDEGAFVGCGSTLIQGIHIGENSIVGAGAVVIRNVPSNSTAVGIPAKTMRR